MTPFLKLLKSQIDYYRKEQTKTKDKEAKVFQSGVVFGLKLAFNLKSKTKFDNYDTPTQRPPAGGVLPSQRKSKI